MWFVLGLIVICFTLLGMARMFLDLRERENVHARLRISDQQAYDKYKSVTQQEALENVTRLIEQVARHELPPAPSHSQMAPSLQELRAQKIVAKTIKEQYLRTDYENFMKQQKEYDDGRYR